MIHQLTQRCRWDLALVLLGWLLTACGTPTAQTALPADQPAPRAASPPGTATSPASSGLVEGRVTDLAGQPIAGALVSAHSIDNPPQPVPERAALTDPHGFYSWPLPPGRHRLDVDPAGYQAGAETVTVQPGQTTT